ncbi:serine/threonine-protein kinase fray2-like isoform X2 [Neocloeon triangulifer]|uniref:serine/threonine-protein kinase fray2-like isoform X2 n=1 Tax=Neocloeon triangulifer TaxID=2078957 RepID=UPI00286F5B43|nr:serine/threonine-protein kinase fray2-like isoform X2 [Neocloeon triangulifer]
MDALADYSSDEDNSDVKEQDELKTRSKKSGAQGDNYENVTMDLSEGSDDNKDSSKRGSKERERSKSSRHDDERRERRHHKSKHSRKDDRERRERRDDKHRSDRDRKYSRRSRSRSPKRRSRSRERQRDRERDRNNRDLKTKKIILPSVEIATSSSATTSTGEKERSISPPTVTSPSVIQLSSGIVPGLTNNPTLTKIQQQLQKRRALWSNKSVIAKETCAKSGNNWESTHLPKDNDGKMTAKFKRLMGMKGVDVEPPEETAPKKPLSAAEQQQKQDEMFNSMERQYEVARLATHTHRGIGLGFGTFQCNPR